MKQLGIYLSREAAQGAKATSEGFLKAWAGRRFLDAEPLLHRELSWFGERLLPDQWVRRARASSDRLSVSRVQEVSRELLALLTPERLQLGLGGAVEPSDVVVLGEVERRGISATVGFVVRGAEIVRAFDPRALRGSL